MTKKIKIEKHIPIPKPRGRGPKEKYPFGRLKVGDSFFIEKKDYHHSGGLAFAASARHKVKLTVRRTDKGVRIWRIA